MDSVFTCNGIAGTVRKRVLDYQLFPYYDAEFPTLTKHVDLNLSEFSSRYMHFVEECKRGSFKDRVLTTNIKYSLVTLFV